MRIGAVVVDLILRPALADDLHEDELKPRIGLRGQLDRVAAIT
jgi:hypothetical protein